MITGLFVNAKEMCCRSLTVKSSSTIHRCTTGTKDSGSASIGNHPAKTELIPFITKMGTNEQRLAISSNVKYPGGTLDSQLNWRRNIELMLRGLRSLLCLQKSLQEEMESPVDDGSLGTHSRYFSHSNVRCYHVVADA